jgi:multiple antibiotic resistance protein
MLSRVIELYFAGLLSLFPIVNPFSTIPLLLSLTPGQGATERSRLALRASRNVAVILITCLVLGDVILGFFGISLPALRVAGGLIIAVIGMRMLFPSPESELAAPAAPSHGQADPALIPLAMPSMSGPGSIAVMIGWSAQIHEQTGVTNRLLAYALGIAAIVTTAVLAWLILRSASTLARRLGDDGIESIKRFMGFLLVCIGVQFIATGVEGFVASA